MWVQHGKRKISEGTSSASNGDKRRILLWSNQNQKLASDITAPTCDETTVIVLECYFGCMYSVGDGLNLDMSAEIEVKRGST